MKSLRIITVLLLAVGILLLATGCNNTGSVPKETPNESQEEQEALDTQESEGDDVEVSYEDNDDESQQGNVFVNDLDAVGNFTGWGVWVYHNFRYEGYFENGIPNGEGTLFEARIPPDERQEGHTYFVLIKVDGLFVNGFANGNISDTRVLEDGITHFWNYNVEQGMAEEGVVDYCSNCSASLFLAEGTIVGGVPPWAGVSVNPSVPAPEGTG